MSSILVRHRQSELINNSPSTDRRKSALKSTPRKSKNYQQSKLAPRYRLFHEDEDVTPNPLNPLVFEDTSERQLSVYELSDSVLLQTRSDKEVNIFGAPQQFSQLASQIYNQSIADTSGGYMASHITGNFEDFSIDEYASTEYSMRTIQSAASTESQIPKWKPPTHISLSLVETETFFILDLPSSTAVKDSEEGKTAQKENEHYEYLTVGKGRNRKIITAETQTGTVLLKTRHTEARQPKKKHNYAFASNWEVYDTYTKELTEGDEEVDTDATLSDDSQVEEAIVITHENKQMIKLLKYVQFQEALIVMERLLANNNYNSKQKRFRCLYHQNPLQESIEYSYKLNLLWTFANSDTEGKSVLAIDWNPQNRDVLAVAYGRFYFKNPDEGMVMIWNIKNPVQPERTYIFPASVTSLQFSKTQSYALAVGLNNGRLEVIDISKREKVACRKNSREQLGNYEALWQVMWYCDDDYYKGEDQIIAAGQDGKIIKFRRTGTITYKSILIMQTARAEGKLKGIETLRKCVVTGVPVNRYSAALLITRHPVDSNVYFVGTGEGVVHRCSTDYFHQHLDLFLAHDGPMYVLKFSPFCNRLFLTCGDDWTARIWCEGISEPLVELKRTMESVQGADWSPKHSTIIATISGSEIFIWDLQRKAYLPQSVTQNPANCKNVVVQFTADGECLVVGDVNGNVHIFALEDMPFPPFFQDDLLTQSLMRAMVNKPELLKQIKKLGKLSFDKSRVGKHFS